MIVYIYMVRKKNAVQKASESMRLTISSESQNLRRIKPSKNRNVDNFNHLPKPPQKRNKLPDKRKEHSKLQL